MPDGHIKASEVRHRVGHPIIDADGHFVELGPILEEELVAYLEEAGGPTLRDKYLKGFAKPFDTSTVLAGRENAAVREQWRAMPSWWGWQTKNTYDRATAHLPKLMYERLDEMGIDFMLVYPSATLGLIDAADVELGGALAHAANRWLASIFAPYKDRMAVGGIVPMLTPHMAIAEADYAVRELGLKTIIMGSYARRYLGDKPASGPQAFRLDTFGIDSEYDYDPFWAKCVELGVAPLTHSSHQNTRVSRSVSSYVYNHVGGLATAHESLAKSLFLGGVTRRFPELKFGFLEGGVAWACSLYADLLGHWSKRNGTAIHDLDPDRLDVDALMGYIARYGDPAVQDRLDAIRRHFSRPAARPAQLDEFARAVIEKPEDIRDLFVPNFYFGCEADDPLVAWAFADKVNPMGARMRAMVGSDISHWDVPDMTEPVEEAYEMVEHGRITGEDFREFTFLNPVRLHAGMNPGFFEGTVVEKAVAAELAKGLD
jgi:predicted TIM-barrel fold metal-dependent hydrolase